MPTRLAARCAAATLVLLMAWSVAMAAEPLGDERARTLLTRTGFAPTPAEVGRFAGLSQPQAVDLLLREATTAPVTPAPAWQNDRMLPPRELRALNEIERKEQLRRDVRNGLDLRAWWMREMVATPSPLTERMTLFWHNHFVSAQPKVRYAQLMYRQNLLLRQHALGNFGTLLHAVARDPAMLIYLDSVSNRRGQPNENFAREVMELFTLGQGHYGESDIKEAARAFTGWSLDPDGMTYKFRRFLHDGGDKTVLGRTGPMNGDDVLDLLLAQPATAQFIVNKLWREFVSPEPDPLRVQALAATFRNSGYDIRTVLRQLLNQPEVVAPEPAQYLVKSPVELVVGLVRQSGGQLGQPVGAAVAVASMGQNLFSAPNVRGWPGGEAWINTQTLLARRQFVERAVGAPAMMMADGGAAEDMQGSAGDEAALLRRRLERAQAAAVRIDTAAWLKVSAGLQPERGVGVEDVQRLARQLMVVGPVAPPAAGELGLDALRGLLLDPAYQLK